MKIERHETGPRMSKAVIHGDTVYLAGIVADNPKGKSTAEQTRSILSQIDGFLATAGTNKTKLLSANIWITDMANFAEMNAVWDAWVSPEIRQRGRPLRPSLHRRTTRSRSWSWRRANSVGPCNRFANRNAQPAPRRPRASLRATAALRSKCWSSSSGGCARSAI